MRDAEDELALARGSGAVAAQAFGRDEIPQSREVCVSEEAALAERQTEDGVAAPRRVVAAVEALRAREALEHLSLIHI